MINEIIEHKREEIEQLKKAKPLSLIQVMAEESKKDLDIGIELLPLSNKPSHLIAECVVKDPVLGEVSHKLSPIDLALYYQGKGFSAISVMTDEKFFGGSVETLRNVAEAVNIPVIRNDFIVDEYQIFETKAYHGDSLILRADVLDTAMMQYFIEIGRDLKLESVCLANNIKELQEVINTDAKIICVNFNQLDHKEISSLEAKVLMAKIKADNQDRIILCHSATKDIETFSKVGYKSFIVRTEPQIQQ